MYVISVFNLTVVLLYLSSNFQRYLVLEILKVETGSHCVAVASLELNV